MPRHFSIIRYLLLCFICIGSFPALADQPDAEIQVSIQLDNRLPSDRFSQNWPVHIYLAAPGSRAPLSYTITQLDRLPLSLTLTEHNQVLPTLSLKGHRQLVLIAKVSSSGDPHTAGAEDYRQTSPVFELDDNQRAVIQMTLQE